MDHTFLLGPGSGERALRAETGRLYLLVASPPAVDRLMDVLTVRLALAAQRQARQVFPYLYILDGGNRFDLHGIARGIAGGVAAGGIAAGGIAAGGIAAGGIAAGGDPNYSGGGWVEQVLGRIQVARAFTCYQVEALLAAAAGGQGAFAAARQAPVLAPRLLTTFADGLLGDGDAPQAERLRLLGRCIGHLKRLAKVVPVVVSAVPPGNPQEAALLARLESAAGQVWRFEAGVRPGAPARVAPPIQLRLFGDRPGGGAAGG